MSRNPITHLALPLAAALIALACGSDPSAPPAVHRAGASALSPLLAAAAADSPHFIDAAVGAPAIANPVVSFYAKRGVDREAFMYYKSRPGQNDSTVFVRFRVPKRSLAFRPDGTPFLPGDSILITMTLVDTVHLEVDFQPAGLVFSTRDPAKLKMSFLEADKDLNNDGVVNRIDARLQRRLAIWKRELSTDPWLKQASVVSVINHEVESYVGGFTSYLIAW